MAHHRMVWNPEMSPFNSAELKGERWLAMLVPLLFWTCLALEESFYSESSNRNLFNYKEFLYHQIKCKSSATTTISIYILLKTTGSKWGISIPLVASTCPWIMVWPNVFTLCFSFQALHQNRTSYKNWQWNLRSLKIQYYILQHFWWITA